MEALLHEHDASNAVWAVLGALTNTLASRLRESHRDAGLEDDLLEDDRTRAAALTAVERFRGVAPEKLSIRSVEVLGDGVVRFEIYDDDSRASFMVEARGRRGGVHTARVRKVTEADPS